MGHDSASASSQGQGQFQAEPTPRTLVDAALDAASASFSAHVHTWMEALLFGIALTVRFYRLDKPSGVVFDEHHFGRFTNQYNAGSYFFDIHPPLGKLVLFIVSRVVGYDYTVCDYTHIDSQYHPDCKFVALRAATAFVSALTVPVMYQIAVNFGAGVPGACLAALLCMLDGLNSTEGRLILIDAQVFASCAIALVVAQAWWRRWNAHWEAVESGGAGGERTGAATDRRYMTRLTRCVWCVFVGIACGNAVSVKFTGLATPGMVAVESFFAFFFLKHAIPFIDLLGVAGVVFPTFAAYWYIHFGLLPNTGDGDQFMPYEFQRSIINSSYYDPAAVRPGFWETTYKLQIDMVVSSNNIAERHHWESFWWEWPVNLRGLAYYSVDRGHTYTETVYLLGNPAVIWLVLGCLGLAVLCMALFFRFRSDPAYGFSKYSAFFRSQGYCMVVYCLNLLPYVGVARSSFIYHYMPALMYGELLSAILVERLAGAKWAPRVAAVVGLVVIATYLFYAPWIYALPLTSEGHARRRWLPRWN